MVNNINKIISSSLKSISQVILIENSVSGLIILMGLFIGDYHLGFIAIVTALVSNIIANISGADKALIERGLFGYNSVLIGLALSLLLTQESRFLIAIFGAVLATIFTATMMHFFSKLEIPILTFPYVVLTWFFLLASYHLEVFHLNPNLIPQDLSKWNLVTQGPIDLFQGLINSIGQVYFQNNIWAGLLILVGVFWGNWRIGIYTVIGSFVGWGTALIFGAEHNLMNLGLYGYNAVLTIIAVSAVFDYDHPLSKGAGIVAAICTVPLAAGTNTLLSVVGLPILTMPFILVSWIFLGARKILPKI